MTAEDQNLIAEIAEDVRREQLLALWKRWRVFILGGAFLIVAGVGGYRAYKAYDEKQALSSTAALTDAIRAVQPGAQAAAKLEAAAKNINAPMPRMLALLQAAAQAKAVGDDATALRIYEALTKERGIIEPYPDFLKLQIAWMTVDQGDPQKLSELLAPLAMDGRPFRYSAREMQGVLALRLGKREEAQAIFTALRDAAEAPQILRDRAGEIVRQMASGS